MVRLIAVACGLVALLTVAAVAVMYYVIWKNAD